MADSPAPSGGKQSFFTEKLGPLPVVAWIAIAGVIFYYFMEKNKKTSTPAAATGGSSGAGSQAAANGTLVDPVTGYLQGSAADVAALASMYDLTTPSTPTPVTNPTPQPQYPGTGSKHKTTPPAVSTPPASTPTPTSPGTTTVTVAPWTASNPTPGNSTLDGIATEYHTTLAAILKLNPSITNPNVVTAGQQVIVPLGTLGSTAATGTDAPPDTSAAAIAAAGAGTKTSPPTQQPSRKAAPAAVTQPPGPGKKSYKKRATPTQGTQVPATAQQGGGKYYPTGVPSS